MMFKRNESGDKLKRPFGSKPLEEFPLLRLLPKSKKAKGKKTKK